MQRTNCSGPEDLISCKSCGTNLPHPSTGLPVSYLSVDEATSLSVPKGSLNQQDRDEIESHVTHTYNFLRIIPWSEHLEMFQTLPTHITKNEWQRLPTQTVW